LQRGRRAIGGAINSRLIYCAITGFGADGPYAERAAFDNVGQALSGWMSRHRRDDDPRVAGPAISDPATSYYAASAVLAALYERANSGRGRLVEVNMLEATIALNLEPLAEWGAIGDRDIDLLTRAETPEAAFELLKAHLTEHHLTPPTVQEMKAPGIAKTGA